jgi:anti-sigma factor RsiW
MTCGDVAQLLDSFVDAELPAPTLLAVARHAGACPSCDLAVRALSTLHDSIERTAREDAETLDLSGVWPVVEERIERGDSRRRWVRRARRAPAWGLALAAAASVFFWFQTQSPEQPATRIAAHPRPNQTVIERINSDSPRFELRRERKFGTTLIMVSTDGEEISR